MQERSWHPAAEVCCRLQREREREEKENKREGRERVEERWLRCLCQRALESILSLFVYNWSCGVRCSTTQNCNNSPFYDDVLTFPKLGCWPGTVTLCMIYCAAEFMPQCWLFLYSKCSSEKKTQKKTFSKILGNVFFELAFLNWLDTRNSERSSYCLNGLQLLWQESVCQQQTCLRWIS